MISLGLDPSLTGFGWCIHNSTVVGPGRVVSCGVFSTDNSMIFLERYRILRSKLMELLEARPEIEGVGVESPPFGEQFSEGLYGLFLFVNEALYLHRKDVVYFDPSSVKMMAKMDPKIRKGTMDKRDMIDAAKADTGIKRFNHNEADAYIVARSAARFWDFYHKRIGEDELVPAEIQSFMRTHTFVQGKQAGQTTRKGLIFREDDRFFRFSQIER